MRVYDPRIGKFLSVDPLTKNFPWYTPYQFAGNKPIWALDLDGLEEYTLSDVINARVNPIEYFNSKFAGFWEGDGTAYEAVDVVNKSVNPVGLFSNGIYGTVAGKDLATGRPVDRLTAFTDMGVNTVMLISGQKFASMFNGTTKLEMQMAANTVKSEAAASSPKSNVNVAAEQQVARANGGTIQTPGQNLRTPGGKTITNSKYAGSLNPSAEAKGFNIPVKANGYPDFGGYLYGAAYSRVPKVNQVMVEMTGNYFDDFAKANTMAGYGRASAVSKTGFIPETPAGFTWHHTENIFRGTDGKIYNVMELVETRAHDAARHAGGAQRYREMTSNTNAYK